MTTTAAHLGMDTLPRRVWERFRQKVDNGHDDFVMKADKCRAFFFGSQWKKADKQLLDSQGRPAMTINKIRPTIKTVLGEQIYNRVEFGFVPRSQDALKETANTLTKLMKQISDNNQLDTLRSGIFFDGQLTSRGFLDCRISFDDNMQGEVRYRLLNPKNVVIDSDAESYDPDDWNDVTVSQWVTYDDIAALYGRGKANRLEHREQSEFFGYDSIDYVRNRFGSHDEPRPDMTSIDMRGTERNIRILDHQYRQLDRQKHFVSMMGDTRQIPEGWDDNKIAAFRQVTGFNVIDKLVRRVRWSVVADDVTLFDEWSPYKHFTVIPYFPVFSHGETAGTVEDLLGPQEILNKVSSQELHVINTTANSGYFVKAGMLANMTPDQLRTQGAQTGIVIEVKENITESIQRITPNQVPTGLDRVSYKAEESIKTISGVTDSLMGQDREDVAAKAIDKKKQSAQTGQAVDLDNLARTDRIIARNTLDLIQAFYTEERVLYITSDSTTQDQESFVINQQAAGEIINDLTLGEYGVVVTSVPARESLQDSEFEQALALRQLGVKMISDETLVITSRLRNKGELIRKNAEAAKTAEGQAAAARAQRAEEAQVKGLENEADEKGAKAENLRAKTAEILDPVPEPGGGDDGSGMAKVQVDAKKAGAAIDQKEREMDFDQQMAVRDAEREDRKLALDAANAELERRDKAAERAQQAAAAALAPQPKGKS